MLYVLIFVIISIFLDYHYNFSNKLFDFPINQKGKKTFLYIIYIFPVAVSTIALSLVDKLEVKDVFTPIISFYATALTITFTVYSFIKVQQATENERTKMEQKDLELRKKELEAEKDRYRPIFVIDTVTENNIPKNKVILIMKDKHLGLENIKYYSNDKKIFLKEPFLNSHQIIGDIDRYPFFITGQTIIGETILFGCYAKNKKIYKYLKPDKHPLGDYYEEALNDAWGDYNTISYKRNSELEKSFFNSTLNIRLELTEFHNNYFDYLFAVDDVSEFFSIAISTMEYHHRKVVKRIYNRNKQVKFNEILNMVLINFINELSNNIEYLSVKKDKYKELELLLYNFIPNRLINKNKLYTNNTINLAYFLRIIRVNMYINIEEDNMLSNTLYLLCDTFDIINFRSNLHLKLSKFKSFILELEKVLE